ncbi:aryl-alcohol dehydrogenase-like predicted oxidoreductase [Neolewinella xylanilytica]|uniref:Aryl-alcohol dehydrogenase-like predicted oxidoreductase n=1 Tax=Neolewinella xylanilytica TaxID=1514080 RepID=A0A2S6I331_9BACT|nr:aldo/keto reductase [Neolewinella xylanilytica]PPK85479.1 aryl-alcohol dehydrogenase-like predicted oxidoreductase [Neolewinella xylanilytica]
MNTKTNNIAEQSGTYTLGNDLTIHRLGYGAMRITGDGIWGPPKDKDEAIRVLKATQDLGINFIDTADSYGPNVSEELIAKALHPYPDGLLVATKGGLERTGPNEWPVNGRPEHLEEALKGSLKRLKLERIDLYQLHRFDEKVPADEFLGKLAELQQQGYIRHLGLSEVNVDQIKQAQEHFEVVSVQNKYSLTDRQWEDEVKWTRENGIGFIPWYPLDAGALENKDLQRIAKKYDSSVYQIAIAWLLAHSDNILPIPGTSSVSHLKENTQAAAIELDDEDVKTLDDLG